MCVDLVVSLLFARLCVCVCVCVCGCHCVHRFVCGRRCFGSTRRIGAASAVRNRERSSACALSLSTHRAPQTPQSDPRQQSVQDKQGGHCFDQERMQKWHLRRLWVPSTQRSRCAKKARTNTRSIYALSTPFSVCVTPATAVPQTTLRATLGRLGGMPHPLRICLGLVFCFCPA